MIRNSIAVLLIGMSVSTSAKEPLFSFNDEGRRLTGSAIFASAKFGMVTVEDDKLQLSLWLVVETPVDVKETYTVNTRTENGFQAETKTRISTRMMTEKDEHTIPLKVYDVELRTKNASVATNSKRW